jgi:hypothetical protein
MKSGIKPMAVWMLIALSLLTLTGFTTLESGPHLDGSHLDGRYTALPQTTIKVDPQSLRLQVGETAKVDLIIEEVSGLYGAEIHVKFDPDVLEVIDADPDQEGIQLEPGTLPIPDFVVLNAADNQAGAIDYAVTQLPPNQPSQGNGIVASITFRAKKPAASSVQFEQFLLADTSGGSIEAMPQHGQIRVVSDLTWFFVIAGASMLFVIGGGIGLAVIKRK